MIQLCWRLLDVQNLVDKDSGDREVQVLNWMLMDAQNGGYGKLWG